MTFIELLIISAPSFHFKYRSLYEYHGVFDVNTITSTVLINKKKYKISL